MAIPLIFIAVIFSAAASLPSCLSSVDRFYHECQSPLLCGSPFPELITYPFWGDSIGRPDFCGQSGFKLTCKDGKIPILQIGNVTLRVISVDQKEHKIRVADENLFKGKCPEIWNFKGEMPYSLFLTTENNNVYNCAPPQKELLPPLLSSISCEGSLGKHVTYYVLDPLSDSEIPFPNCKKVGEIPMLESVQISIHMNRSLTETLKEGFYLHYSIEGPLCKRCTNSDGICGSDSYTDNFRCLCQDKPHEIACNINDHGNTSTHGQTDVINPGSPPAATRVSDKGKLAIGIACGILGLIVLGGGLIIIYRILFSRQKKTQTFYRPSNLDLDAILPVKQYSYRELKKITSSLTHIVGKGGFGTVYQGQLVDGRQVAVKILKDSNGNADDFINEVISISQTSHINIVALLGFCFQGSTRALVYEFLENGTLEQFISSNNSLNRDIRTLYGIALGVAKGLQYLHYGCKTRIVHFDIKPQNILLDNNLCPKISDFGLAKICDRRESIMSSINPRGTIGYIAPEICSRMYGEVTHKADVYSYGMLIVDMIGARNKERQGNAGASSSSTSTFFPDWMHEIVVNGEYQKILGGNEIREEEEEDDDDVGEKMILVGLWCIQTHPSDRPSMEKVVEMMEGRLESIEIPPKVSFQIPTSSLLESSNDNSNSTFATKETMSSKFVP